MSAVASAASNPWKGLHFYTEEDRRLFFGREAEAEDLLRLAQRDILTVLFARSGLGKTSLLRAGVVPRLREMGFLPVLLRPDYAASAPPPAAQAAAAVLAAAASARVEAEAVEGADPLEECGTLWEFFHRHQFWSPRNDPVRPVLILDQFEEVFTLGRQSPRASEFIEQLADLAENRMPRGVRARLDAAGGRLAFDTGAQHCKIILSLRDDYVSKLDSLRPLMPAVMRNRYELAPLDRERALKVVRQAGGPWVRDAVALDIVAAVAGDDAEAAPGGPARLAAGEVEPAYLSVMCDELFRRMVAQGKAEIDAGLLRAERGDILDALYERSFAELSLAARVFVEDRLLTPGGFRGSLPAAEAGRDGVAPSDLESLVNSRLLRFEERLGARHVELSHDLLAPIVRKSRDARWAEAKAEAEREAERRRRAEFAAKLRRERRRLWAALAAVVLLAATIGGYYLGWLRPYQTYCRDFSKRWGAAYPVGPLPAAAAGHRASTLRLTRKGWFGEVYAVEVIDAKRRLTSNASISTYLSDSGEDAALQGRPARFEFVRDRQGRVVYEIAFDRLGRMVWGFVYAPGESSAVGQPRSRKAMFLGADGYPRPQGRSRAEFVEFHYDGRGFETEWYYFDREGNPMPGRDDAYGQRAEYDGEGRRTRLTSLDRAGQPMNDAVGNAGAEAKYDKEGNVAEGRTFDAQGGPTLVRSGYHRGVMQYDEWGRNTETRFFNLSGEPVEETEQTGAHRISWEYDERGNVTSMKLYDKAGRPAVAGGKMWEVAAHEQRVAFDAENRAETVAYFGGAGEPLAGPEGWHSYRLEYDPNGFVSATDSFDAAGKPVNQKTSGAHRWARVNDALGQPVEERFYDTEGRPVATLDGGYHLRRNAYDKAGNLAEQSYFGVDGGPVADRAGGAHRYAKRFDRFRHPVLTQSFGTAGQPIDNKQGFHKNVSTYDDYGSELSSRWFDKEDRPALGPAGAHEIRNTYDGLGLLQRSAYYDADNRPAANRLGVHEAVYAFNEKRQQTRRQVFGLNRKPAEDQAGNHLMLDEFDGRGRPTRETRLRADGRPNWDRELGIATVRRAYDREGKWTEQAFYDAADRLAAGPWGFAKGCFEPQPDGRLARVNYGADGKPVFNPLLGFAIKKTDDRTEGDTVESFHDAGGALIAGPEGYAEARRRWGGGGKLLSVAYFGPDGAPVAGPGGFHRAEWAEGGDSPPRRFAADGRELASPGPEAAVPVIVLAEVLNLRLPAAKAGVQAGDILWRYGAWSFPEALAAERAKGTAPDAILKAIVPGFFAERDRLSGGPAAMAVVRQGRLVPLAVPPLPNKTIGARLSDRAVPAALFEAWKNLGPDKQAGPSGTN